MIGITRVNQEPFVKAKTFIANTNLCLNTGIKSPNVILIEPDLVSKGEGELFVTLPYSFSARRDLTLDEYSYVVEYCRDCMIKIPDCALYGGVLNKVDVFNESPKRDFLQSLCYINTPLYEIFKSIDIQKAVDNWTGYYAGGFHSKVQSFQTDGIMYYLFCCIAAQNDEGADSEGLRSIVKRSHTTLGYSIQESCVKGVLSCFKNIALDN